MTPEFLLLIGTLLVVTGFFVARRSRVSDLLVGVPVLVLGLGLIIYVILQQWAR